MHDAQRRDGVRLTPFRLLGPVRCAHVEKRRCDVFALAGDNADCIIAVVSVLAPERGGLGIAPSAATKVAHSLAPRNVPLSEAALKAIHRMGLCKN